MNFWARMGPATVIFLLAVLAPAVGEACSCVVFDKTEEELTADLQAELDRAVAVFVGRALSGDLYDATFEVTQVWKGDVGKTVTMYTSAPSRAAGTLTVSSCDYFFTRGVTYLVFAYGSLARMQAYQCSSTADAVSAQATLKRLSKIAAPQLPKTP